jgi:hypothetical protein
MDFPTKEADIVALGDLMRAGYISHPADFPHILSHPLVVRLTFYRNALKAQKDAIALAKLATEAKRASLNTLKEVMISCLRKSEVDAADNPEKLTEIGWGPKAIPQAAEAPGEPKNLVVAEQGKTTLRLQWDRPQAANEIRNYIVERRESTDGGVFGKWIIIGTAINDWIILNRQPRGIQLEFRVKAVSTAGESTPGNVVSVVL